MQRLTRGILSLDAFSIFEDRPKYIKDGSFLFIIYIILHLRIEMSYPISLPNNPVDIYLSKSPYCLHTKALMLYCNALIFRMFKIDMLNIKLATYWPVKN